MYSALMIWQRNKQVKQENKKYKFRAIVSEVSSLVGNTAYTLQ